MTAQTLAAANSPRQTRLHSKRSGPDRKSKHPSSPARSLSAAPTHPLLCRSFDRTSSAQATLAGGLCRSGTERSEEHTSELQSRENLVCRLLLEKKKNVKIIIIATNEAYFPTVVCPYQSQPIIP